MTIDALIDLTVRILSLVESDGRCCPPNGDNGKAVGPFQMHTVMVDECNRLLGGSVFCYDDRRSPTKSEAMARLFLRHMGVAKNITQPPKLAARWNKPARGDITKDYRIRIIGKWQEIRVLCTKQPNPAQTKPAWTFPVTMSSYAVPMMSTPRANNILCVCVCCAGEGSEEVKRFMFNLIWVMLVCLGLFSAMAIGIGIGMIDSAAMKIGVLVGMVVLSTAVVTWMEKK